MQYPLTEAQCAKIRAAQSHFHRSMHLALAAVVLNFCAGFVLLSGDTALGMAFTFSGVALILFSYMHRKIGRRLAGEFYRGE